MSNESLINRWFLTLNSVIHNSSLIIILILSRTITHFISLIIIHLIRFIILLIFCSSFIFLSSIMRLILSNTLNLLRNFLSTILLRRFIWIIIFFFNLILIIATIIIGCLDEAERRKYGSIENMLHVLKAAFISYFANENTIVLFILGALRFNPVNIYLSSFSYFFDRFIIIVLKVLSLFQNKQDLDVVWVLFIIIILNVIFNRSCWLSSSLICILSILKSD